MRQLLWLVVGVAVLGMAIPALAQDDVTQPGDLIELVNGVNDGDGNSGPPPGAETVNHAIDNVTQKYLNFLDLGSGFKVTPSIGPTVLSGIRLYTANDAEERDPASVLLEGSNDGSSFTEIFSSDLELPSSRNSGGSIPIDPTTQNLQELAFDNTAHYSVYRVTFPTLKNAGAANSMQIAEVELLGEVYVPEPSTIVLAGFAVAALAVQGIRRRK